MREVTLVRDYLPTRTEGIFSFGPRNVPTIERANHGDHPCIPEGVYTITKGHMAEHNVDHYLVSGVPDHVGIFLHFINMMAPSPETQLLGCIGFSEASLYAFEKWANWEDLRLTVRKKNG
jgi:hypothetical protein